MPAYALHYRSTPATTLVTTFVYALVIACVTTISTKDAFAHGVTFKVHHAQPADSAFHENFLEPWAHKIHAESSGKINLLISPGDPNNSDSGDLFNMVKDRTADIVWLNIQEPATSFPKFAVFGLPLSGTTSEGSSRALWAYVDEYDLGFREFGKMRLLAASRHDAPLFHMREKNIRSLSDLTGTRIAIPNSDAADLLTSLGASPVPTPKSAIREVLASAKVDGVLLSWSSLATLKLEELVKTHSAFPGGTAWPYAEISALVMHPDAYRSLADDLKQAVKGNSGGDASALIGKVFDASAARARQRVTERGEVINVLPSEELAKWQDAVDVTIGKRIKELDGRSLRGNALVGKARELLTEFDVAR